MITIEVDGATGALTCAGVAAVARGPDGGLLGLCSRQLGRMTNNEAEYHALLLGIELAQALGLASFVLQADSEVMVRQMQGRSRVNSARLALLHRQACQALRFVGGPVTFRHVLREHNRLADALAVEAMAGRAMALPARVLPLQTTQWQRLVARLKGGKGHADDHQL